MLTTPTTLYTIPTVLLDVLYLLKRKCRHGGEEGYVHSKYFCQLYVETLGIHLGTTLHHLEGSYIHVGTHSIVIYC